MASVAASVPAAIEQAVELFEAERRPASMRLRDGYLDLLEAGDAPASHPAQRLLNTRVVPVVYERFGHPFAMRMLGGRRVGLWSKEQLLAVKMLGAGRGERVLDIACGPGNFTRTYADVAGDATVVGLDLSRAMLAYAARHTERPNVAYLRADACSLPFRAHSFPAVSCFGAMHLFENPMGGLDEMVRVLAPGGRLAVGTTCQSPRRTRLRGWYTFGRDELAGALAERGLDGIEQRVMGGLQFVWAHRPHD